MKFGVVIFPGSNCDRDTLNALELVSGESAAPIWHKEKDLKGFDCVVLPGGFSYGDYLRAGAIARFSPVMEAVIDFANNGGLVIGICNGFQILMEAGLLPGALMVNRDLLFISKMVNLHVDNSESAFTNQYHESAVIKMPIAHYQGNFHIDSEGLRKLKENKRIIFRYSDPAGDPDPEFNPNGSLENIAGIINDQGNVLGMMPHFERACESILGSDDGRGLIKSVMESLNK